MHSNSKTWQIEVEARKGQQGRASYTAAAVVDGNEIECKAFEMYHNAAQRLMVQTRWAVNGKRTSYNNVLKLIG